ncbi:MAG: hypothetical protein K5989_09340 [Lachnospiraceae bacterium]|nr:hypothetical protein [Lachnospiraceae bacterium]
MKGKKETENVEISDMWPSLEGIETVFEPQCVECPFNQGAIACSVYGEKPAKYMANAEACPKE